MQNTQTVNRSRRNMAENYAINGIGTYNGRKHVKTSSCISGCFQLVASIILGAIFGFFMNKANIHLAPIIREQMLFLRLTMIKMFLAAVGMSMLSVGVLILCCETTYRRALDAFIDRNSRINAISIVVGGILIGIGMVLAGSCPGTIFIQIGAGLPNSPMLCFGAVCGVLFYYMFLHRMLTKYELTKSAVVLRQLSDIVRVKQIYLNVVLGLVCIFIAFTLEYVVHYKDDLLDSEGVNVLMGWPPAICGLVIGCLQLFFIIFFQKSLGISTGFTVFIAQLCRFNILKCVVPSLDPFARGVSNMTALLFAVGAMAGSFIAAKSFDQFPADEEYGASVWCSFIGGFLLLVGARCAGGCTSGQGISGVSHLLMGSFLATAAMFGGGISFAVGYGLITKDWSFHGL